MQGQLSRAIYSSDFLFPLVLSHSTGEFHDIVFGPGSLVGTLEFCSLYPRPFASGFVHLNCAYIPGLPCVKGWAGPCVSA